MRSLKKIDLERRIASKRQPTEMPEVTRPRAGIFKTAFGTAAHYKATAKAIRAYKEAVQEAGQTQLALADLEEAKLERQRAIHLMEDAEIIHEADAAEREQARIEAVESLKNAQVTAGMAAISREQCIVLACEAHDHFMKDFQKKRSRARKHDTDEVFTSGIRYATNATEFSLNPKKRQR